MKPARTGVHQATMVHSRISRQLPKKGRNGPRRLRPRLTGRSPRILLSKSTGPDSIWAARPARPKRARVWGSAPMRRKTLKGGACQDRSAVRRPMRAPECPRESHRAADATFDSDPVAATGSGAPPPSIPGRVLPSNTPHRLPLERWRLSGSAPLAAPRRQGAHSRPRSTAEARMCVHPGAAAQGNLP